MQLRPALCLALLAATTVARADTFDRTRVSASATWVAHADLSRLRGTQVGTYFLEQLSTPEVDAKFAAFTAVFRFDPRRDLDGVTLYGTGKGEDQSVGVFTGRFDPQQLVTLVGANETYSSQLHAGQTIHSWIDDKKQKVDPATGAIDGDRSYGCVARNDTLVLGNSLAMVKQAVDVLDGRASNLSGTTRFIGADNLQAATFFVASADVANMPDLDPKAAILKRNEAVSLALGEDGDNVVGTLVMAAKDAETAQLVHGIATGLMSLMLLQGQEDPQAARLAQALKLNLNGKQVEVNMAMPAQDAITIMKAGEQGGRRGARRRQQQQDDAVPAPL